MVPPLLTAWCSRNTYSLRFRNTLNRLIYAEFSIIAYIGSRVRSHFDYLVRLLYGLSKRKKRPEPHFDDVQMRCHVVWRFCAISLMKVKMPKEAATISTRNLRKIP